MCKIHCKSLCFPPRGLGSLTSFHKTHGHIIVDDPRKKFHLKFHNKFRRKFHKFHKYHKYHKFHNKFPNGNQQLQ